MKPTHSLLRAISRMTADEKTALADHLWRESEGEVELSVVQLAKLNRRVMQALRNPELTKPVGDAVRRMGR